MASGQLFSIIPCPPGLKYALEDVWTSTSTATGAPYNNHPVWRFDGATGEAMDFYGRLVGYGSGGLTLYMGWATTTTATGSGVFGAAFRRIDADAEDLDASIAYAFNYATDVQTSTVGLVSDFTITFTDGADMDSVANNEAFAMRVFRNATATGDTSGLGWVLQGGMALKET